jgi:N-acetylmuramoyl-L-alanine amidase
MRRAAAAAVALLLVLAACSSGDDDGASTTSTSRATATTTTAPTTTATTFAPTTTTATTVAPLPAMRSDAARVLATPTGFVLPIEGGGPGAWTVMTPCGTTAVVHGGDTIGAATVVIDPGHGGEETGTAGPGGTVERDLNLAIAQRLKATLEKQGATVVLTRTGDYRIALTTRAEIAQKLKPPVFVSVHHNGGHDEVRATPGTEVYFQLASPASKRLAGLLYEEEYRFFSSLPNHQWYADRDAGAKYRANDAGGDYYGILRRTNGVTAALSEGLFLTDPAEEALLVREDVQQGEADAIARGIRRFMLSDDAGTGFVTPYARTEPAGPGGGSGGCVDPPLE